MQEALFLNASCAFDFCTCTQGREMVPDPIFLESNMQIRGHAFFPGQTSTRMEMHLSQDEQALFMQLHYDRQHKRIMNMHKKMVSTKSMLPNIDETIAFPSIFGSHNVCKCATYGPDTIKSIRFIPERHAQVSGNNKMIRFFGLSFSTFPCVSVRPCNTLRQLPRKLTSLILLCDFRLLSSRMHTHTKISCFPRLRGFFFLSPFGVCGAFRL
jgi:hypothetical protein